MPPPTLKAAGFNSYVIAAKKVVGDMSKVLDGMSDATRKLIEHPPLAMVQVPSGHYFELTERLVERAFGNDERRLRDVSREQLKNDLNGVYRFFIRFASPDYIIGQAAQVYGTYWKDNGTIRTEKPDARSVRVIYEGVPTPPSAFWQLQCGAVQSALEATGAKSVGVEIVGTAPNGAILLAKWS